MSAFKEIPIDKINEGERLRPLTDGYVALLAESIGERGLLSPIAVYQTPRTDRWTLIHGLHRLTAMRRLGWQTAPCMVMSATDSRVNEIHENLIRNELSLLERADAVIALREDFEAKHGPITRGGKQSITTTLWSDELDHVADRIGVSRVTLARWQTLRTLDPGLKAMLYGTVWADRLGILTTLAKMQPADQLAIVDRVTSGEATLDEAIEKALAKGGKKPDVDRDQNRFIAVFARLDKRTRKGSLIELIRKYPDEHRAALREIERGDG